MLEKSRVLARQERIDKKRRDLIQRHLQPVRAGEPAVDFPIHVEDRVALRHITDGFQAERLPPDGVEHHPPKNGGDWQRDQRQLPANAKLASTFFWRSASKELHWGSE